MANDYPNSGALFKNDRKEQPNHPDYKGSAEIDGVDYWLSAWIKEGKSGKFMSLSFKPKEEQSYRAPATTADDMGDVPF